jgi:predicted PhzF superfamily epimerase YddE/YHI9|tara:strand:- start:1439 stop:2116 length:678 start_codon:yes stop_codon:yes gene_type:complete
LTRLHVLKVFVGANGRGGNPLGVFLDGGAFTTEQRQPVATSLNYSETVFVDDTITGRLQIFTPAAELPFAGHPLVGTAWLLNKEGHAIDAVRPPAGVVPVSFDGDTTWIRGRPEWSPSMEFVQYDSPSEINGLTGPPDGIGFAYCWAWEDEPGGRVRARVFVPEHNIFEDEATGSGAVVFAAHIGRAVTVNQGAGSLLMTRLHDDGAVSVGGAVTLTRTRSYTIG